MKKIVWFGKEVNMNNLFLRKIEYLFFPKTDRETNVKIDTANIVTIHYVCLAVFLVQSVTLIVYSIMNMNNIYDYDVMVGFASVGFSIIYCVVGYILTGYLRRKPLFIAMHHKMINILGGLFFTILIAWGMFVSEKHFARGEQIITFYIVELCVLMFVKLRPLVSATLIVGSYIIYFFVLNSVHPGKINPYNFAILGLFCAVSTVLNYRNAVNSIQHENRIEVMNKSFMVIAEHDVMTRLKNRYSLNQIIPEYLNNSVCLALGDIDKFKVINDTLGHNKGDEALKYAADKLVDVFGKEKVYRYGGDEFLVVCVDEDFDKFNKMIDLFNEKLAECEFIQGFHCTFGSVCRVPASPVDFSKMITDADAELYEKKGKYKK